MISTQDLERLIQRQDGGTPVLSLFLDMSVDSNNKRNHHVFLGQKRAQFEELDGNRPIPTGNGHESGMGSLFERVQGWIDAEFNESNRGVVIYSDVGGDWFEALQFPVPVQNRLVVADRPVVGPLAQVLNAYEHYGVILMDREHVRILSVYLGTLLDELEFRGDPLPVPSHVQAGGFARQGAQQCGRHDLARLATGQEVHRPGRVLVGRPAPVESRTWRSRSTFASDTRSPSPAGRSRWAARP